MAFMLILEAVSVALEATSLYMAMTQKPQIGGPKLTDLRVTTSTYGSPIREGWGVFRCSGNIIYSSILIEHPQNGKGFGGPTQYQYTWSGAVAISNCDDTGPIGDILRIWADTKLVFDKTGQTNGGTSQYGLPQQGKGGGSPNHHGQGPGGSWYNNVGTFRVYTGTQDQMPDAVAEALFGADNCNANRGLAYVVFDNINLINYGNRVPNFTFEVAATGTSQNQLSQAIIWNASDTTVGAVADSDVVSDPLRQRAYFFFTGTNTGIKVVDLTTRKEIKWATHDQIFGSNGDRHTANGAAFCGCVGTNGYLYISCWAGSNSSPIVKIDPDALIEVGSFGFSNSGLTDTTTSFITSQTLIPFSINGENFIAAMAFPSGFMQLGIINADTMAYVTSGVFGMPDSVVNIVGGVPLTLTSVSLYAVGHDRVQSSTPANIYEVTIGFGSGGLEVGTTLLRSINPSDIDSEWTQFFVAGPIFDQTDGNLLVFFEDTHDSLTAGHAPVYLTKISATDGSLIWKTNTNNPGFSFGTIHGAPSGLEFWQNSTTLGNYAFIDNMGSGHYQVIVVETQSGAIEAQSWAGLQVDGEQVYADEVGAILFFGDLTGTLVDQWGVIVVNAAQANAVPLETVVSNICAKVGFASKDIDVTQLFGVDVLGYVLEAQMDAADALKPLALAFTFDSCESDNKLKFVPRGGSSVVTVPATDFGYMDKKLNLLVNETRMQEVDLPNQVSVGFLDAERDFQKSVQYYRRPSNPYPVMFSKNPRTEELPLVMEAFTAKQLAEKLLFMQWVNRVSYKTKMPWRYLPYDPTDVITITLFDGTTIATRAATMTIGADSTIEMTSVAESGPVFSANDGAFGGNFPQNLIIPSSATKMFLLDTPLLRDIDDTGQGYSVMYYALGAYTPSWLGGSVFSSTTGQNFQLVGSIGVPGVAWGVCVNALGDVSRPFKTDRVNTLTVSMASGGSTLSSTTVLGMLNGANGAAILNVETGIVEVIQFQTVTANADGTFTLSNLLRGRRGTETMRGAHVVGEYFILLTQGGTGTINTPLTQRDMVGFYESISHGQDQSSAIPVQFTDTMRTLMPYAPVHMQAVTDMSNDLVLTWYRRTRINGEMHDGTGIVPLNEVNESYSIDIYDAPGTTILRTLSVNNGSTPVAFPTVTYPNAEVIADFGSVPSSLTFEVYQISGAVGRGFGTKVTVVVNGEQTP